MDIVNTSLEALIQRATCNQNQCPDTAAIDAFCGLINKEPESILTATRFITAKVHSMQEWEALQALHVLDTCMKRCGSNFQAEVGKFRFLNELIKLVSPKYNGAYTPEPVKRQVVELLQAWTVTYPREFKIKEAYGMLKKQGVIVDELLRPLPVSEAHKSLEQNMTPPPPSRQPDSIFTDSEKSRMLQKLLQSKNPDDLQAANRLIKTMVKEDERRGEMKSLALSEVEAAHNNARLLSEMLDSHSRDRAASSANDIELINELRTSCVRYRPSVQRLLSDTALQIDQQLFNEVLAANDELGAVLEKFNTVIVQGLPASAAAGAGAGSNLLDLSTPNEESRPLPPLTAEALLCDQLTTISTNMPLASSIASPLPPSVALLSSVAPPPPLLSSQPALPLQPRSELASLGDIFSSLSSSAQPLVQMQTTSLVSEKPTVKTGLEELDALSESLLKQSLPRSVPLPHHTSKPLSKVPMNQLPSSLMGSPAHHCQVPGAGLDLLTDLPQVNGGGDGDSLMVDIASDLPAQTLPDTSQQRMEVEDARKMETITTETKTETTENTRKSSDSAVKPLGDLTVPLDSIKPGGLPPLPVLQERGVTVTIHCGCAVDSPRADVSVFVVTTTCQSQVPITNYLFQAIVPKGYRLRLQPPSSTELPAHNPFLPPAAITQVMLIASPNKEPIMLRVVVSFTMDDETVTEMKEVEQFPLYS